MSVYERDPNTGNLNLVAGNMVYEDENSIINKLNRIGGTTNGKVLDIQVNIDDIDMTSKYYINSDTYGGPEAAWGLVETDVSSAGNIIQRWYGLTTNTAYFRNRLSGTWTSWIPLSTPFKLGIDGSGNYGYYKAGADTVTPFKNGELKSMTGTQIITSVGIGSTVDFNVEAGKYYVVGHVVQDSNRDISSMTRANKITHVRVRDSNLSGGPATSIYLIYATSTGSNRITFTASGGFVGVFRINTTIG